MALDYGAILSAGRAAVPDILQRDALRSEKAHRDAMTARANFELKQALGNEQSEADYLAEASEVFAAPTAELIARLQARYPQHSSAIKSAWAAKEEAQRQRDTTQLGSIYNLLRLGKRDRAAKMARERYEADLRGGLADDGDLALVELLENGDDADLQEVGSAILVELAGALGPEKMAAAWADLQEESRQQDLHPSRMRQQADEAAKAAAEAESAPAYYSGRAAQEQAQAQAAASDATWRDRRNAATVEGMRSRSAVAASREARLQSDRGTGESTKGGRRKGSAPNATTSRPKYLRYGVGPNGERWGFNAQARKWERVR